MTRYSASASSAIISSMTVACTCAYSHPPWQAPNIPPSATAVRLFSLDQNKLLGGKSSGVHPHLHQSATSKIVHLVRHAEGTHNLSEEESKLPKHFDATLTLRGIEECNRLARRTKDLAVEAVLVSPMTRCLETARLSFPHLYYGGENGDGNAPSTIIKGDAVPFVAHEQWRETLNYLCDSRRPVHVLEKDYPRVDFGCLSRDRDPIWAHYEATHGSYTDHTSLRESADAVSLCNRVHSAWKVVLDRPERHLALVSHSAFFMHMFMPLFKELEGAVQYEDDVVEELMTSAKFENCELRSVVVDAPI